MGWADPEKLRQWRLRAAECRTLASGFADAPMRKMMRDAADELDKLVDDAERAHAGDKPRSLPP